MVKLTKVVAAHLTDLMPGMAEELTPRQLKQLEKQERRKKYADLAIQGTNNSSIASKRSVELLYLPRLGSDTVDGQTPNEYFKYFVKKSPKRSPCINRGYWLRLHAIRSRLNSIVEGTQENIVVVNLGCGFDPLPFELLDQRNLGSEKFNGRVQFLDVDYADLINEKARIIEKTPQLSDIVGPRLSQRDCVVYGTETYSAASCNLNYPKSFEDVLNLFDLNNPKVVKVFIAEVSLAYMLPNHADDIVKICGSMSNSHFLMLEQLTPAGTNEPFSKQMLRHFRKNNSPLLSVEKYFTIESQKRRFRELGFPHVNAGDMFNLWQSVDPEKRSRVQSVELFDELEEFHLFCHHYIICHATNDDRFHFDDTYKFSPSLGAFKMNVRQDVQFEKLHSTIDRKFGAAALPTRNNRSILYFGGSNPCRLSDLIDINARTGDFVTLKTTGGQPEARMCHSLTSLGDSSKLILIGGRGKPHDGRTDTWIFDYSSCTWFQGPELPEPRYRHCATLVNGNIVVFGGATDGAHFLIYNVEKQSFETCKVAGIEFDSPLVSAAMDFSTDAQLGVIVSGSTDEVTVSDALSVYTIQGGKIVVQKTIRHPLLQRYGAKVSFITNNEVLIVGGTSPEMLFDQENSMIIVNLDTQKITGIEIHDDIWQSHPLFLVGFDMIKVSPTEHIVTGGGATCYGFGSVSNYGFKIKLEGN